MSEELSAGRSAPKHTRRLVPLSWGAGLLFGAFLCALRFVPLEAPSQQDGLFAALLALTAGGAVAAAALFASQLFSAHGCHLSQKLVTAGSTVACLLGLSAIASLYGILPALPLTVLCLASGLFGAGCLVLAVLWGEVYGRMEPEVLLPNGAVSLVVASFVHGVQDVLGPTSAGILLIVVTLIASTVLLWRALRLFPTGAEDTAATDSASASLGGAAALKSIASSLWMPLAGACLSSFIFGLIWDPVMSEEHTRRVMQESLLGTMSGSLLTALIVAAITLRDQGTSPLRLFNQGIFPFAVALLLVIPVVSESFPALQPITSVLSSAGFAIVGLSVWCSMASLCRTLSLQPSLVFSWGFCLLGVFFGCGLVAILGIGTAGRTLCLVLFAFYLALIALYFARSSKEERESRVVAPPVVDTRSFIHRRCDELADEYGISPREKEVLFYLGRGYNHTYIAKKLFVSENTVRTHVRHIYAKLGVSSREELLDLIDEKAQS